MLEMEGPALTRGATGERRASRSRSRQVTLLAKVTADGSMALCRLLRSSLEEFKCCLSLTPLSLHALEPRGETEASQS